MKRFYTAATVAPVANSPTAFAVHLDGKPLVTPSRSALAVPTRALAIAIAREWNDHGETIDLRAMPLTGLANAAVDRVAQDRDSFIDGMAVFGESDLLCYRVDAPAALATEQAAAWNPILDWSERAHGHAFAITQDIVHVAQPPATLAGLRDALAAHDDFRLAALHPIVTIGGSLVAALALAAGAVSSDDAWAAVTIDDAWQARQWGQDAAAANALALRKAEWDAAVRFIDLLG